MDLSQAFFDRFRNFHGICARLFVHCKLHGRITIQPHRRRRLFSGVLGGPNIAYLDGVSVSVGNGNIIEIRRICDLARGADREIRHSGFQAPARHFHVLGLQSGENIRNRKVVGAQPFRIHNDVDFTSSASLDFDLAHTGAVFKLLLNQLVGNHRYIAGGTRRRYGDLQNRLCIRIHLRDNRDFGA